MIKISLFLFVFNFLTLPQLLANTEAIPLINDASVLPSVDLIKDGQKLDSEESYKLSRFEKFDLSKLDPEEDIFWSKIPTKQNDDILINLDKAVDYQSEIGSSSNMIRINVSQEINGTTNNYLLYFDKFLHAAFLRKNLLRKMGYILPRMKYIKSLKLRFRSLEEKQYFLKEQVNKATRGAPTRWISKKEIEDDKILTVTVKDIAVFRKRDRDYMDIFLAPSKGSNMRRVIRSLIAPFALLGLRESVNSFEWSMGQIKNKNLLLNHILENASFNASIDDVKWAFKIIEKLKRKDFKEIVNNAFFPEGVRQVVLEKIISRRNIILSKLKLNFKKIKVDYKINFKNIVKDSKILKQEWDGYASRFSYDYKQTPFDEYQYFFFSKIRSAALDNVLSEANKYFKTFDIAAKQKEFHKKQFKSGLQHFIKTGELGSFPVKTWHSPFFNFNLIINRDVVVGNYMGSDNLVQLADTTGVAIDMGVHYGIENIGQYITSNFQLGSSVNTTITHLKPIVSLKAAYKQPMLDLLRSNERYPKAFMQLSKAAESKDKDKIKEASDLLKKYLGKGESLILTENITPRFNLAANFTFQNLILSPTIGTKRAMIKRIQFFRKDENTIQVYSDKGHSWDFYLGARVDAVITGLVPIINIKAKKSKGKYMIHLYDIDLSSDLEKNPNLSQNSFALYSMFKDRSSELLDDIQKPIKIENSFDDDSFKFNFLFLTYKALNQQGEITVTPRKGNPMKFINLIESSQSGINKEVLVRDAMNYYLKQYVTKYKLEVPVGRFHNPGQSIGGKSHSTFTRLQVKIENDGSENYPVLSIEDRHEGWSLKNKNIEKFINKINDRYKYKLFRPEDIKGIKKLRLYDISSHFHLYYQGLDRIKNLTLKMFKKLKVATYKGSKCYKNKNVKCGKFQKIEYFIKKCSDKSVDLIKQNKCILKLTKILHNSLDIVDFKKILGEGNYYIFGSINGFRVDNEILNDTINSDYEGQIGDVFFQGPLDTIMMDQGISTGEFKGWWLRENL